MCIRYKLFHSSQRSGVTRFLFVKTFAAVHNEVLILMKYTSAHHLDPVPLVFDGNQFSTDIDVLDRGCTRH